MGDRKLSWLHRKVLNLAALEFLVITVARDLKVQYELMCATQPTYRNRLIEEYNVRSQVWDSNRIAEISKELSLNERHDPTITSLNLSSFPS